MTPPAPGPLLSVRAAVVLLLAVEIGVLAGVLTFLAHHSVPEAVLAGGAAFGGALLLCHAVVGK